MEVSTHPELPSEQAHLDRAHSCLEAMVTAGDAAVAALAERTRGGDYDAAQAGVHLRRYRRSLDVGDLALCFGRIVGHDASSFHIGRRHVADADGAEVVVDWRAPAAVPFYRATAVDHFDLELRRRFSVEGRTITSLLDERFDDPESLDAIGGIPDPLLAELDRRRTGDMRDIVATIQAEQDAIVRAPREACLVVQGGPGTGKTAVGLHRAAWLLYEHRRELEESGVLVIGPNPEFLRYIAQVLPSLGEGSVVQTTVTGLRSTSWPVTRGEPVAVATLKGDPRMAIVVANACRARLRPVADAIKVGGPWGVATLAPDDANAAMDAARQERTLTLGRDVFAVHVARRLHEAIDRRQPWLRLQPSEVLAALRANRTAMAALDKAWPSITPDTVITKLFASRASVKAAADGVLSTAEQALLVRPRGESGYSAADVALLDEAEHVIRGARRVYGHVVVDEAQDHSAMALRLLGRRALGRSMTVLGDLAQATTPWAQQSWDDVIDHLGGSDVATVRELHVGYRVPAPILELANRLLPEAAPDVAPSRSVRAHGEAPRWVTVDPDARLDAVADELATALSEWASVAVIAPDDLVDELRSGLAEVIGGSDVHVAVLGALEAKGLEFDAVIVVEPGAVHAQVHGARQLYVALTRAVQRLALIGALPLPPALAGAGLTPVPWPSGSRTQPR